MELNENLKKVLTKLGIGDAELALITADDANIDDITTEINDKLVEVYQKTNPKHLEDAVKGKVIAATKQLKKDFGRKIGMTNSGSQLEEMSSEDFIKEVGLHISSKIAEGKNATDGEKDKTIGKLNDDLVELKLKIDSLESGKENEIAAIKAESAKKIIDFKLSNISTKVISDNADKWGVPMEFVHRTAKDFNEKLKSAGIEVTDDGKLTPKDGKYAVIDGNSYKTYEEAFLVDAKSALKQNNATGEQRSGTLAGGIVTDGAPQATKDFAASLEAYTR